MSACLHAGGEDLQKGERLATQERRGATKEGKILRKWEDLGGVGGLGNQSTFYLKKCP